MPAQIERWTPDRVRALIDESRAWPRYELIDGELLVTPAPRPVHQVAVVALIRLLADYVERIGMDVEVFASPADLELRAGTIVQPDVFVAPLAHGQSLPDWTPIRSLLLAVEILSPASARYDRTVKRHFFVDTADVTEYWVVDLDARLIERWRHAESRPALVDGTLEWRPLDASEPLLIDLPAFFARVHREQ
ncbi:MAG: Uma2 family endonuclease [Gemmatimonadaceae bacterium]